ncbi:hypothetical protein FRB94_004837 [Tulasnella sp. JGI-2019a]|nr:hypothetical protein FRB94_004837 [Tulasnella sp. JGI-2019a]
MLRLLFSFIVGSLIVHATDDSTQPIPQHLATVIDDASSAVDYQPLGRWSATNASTFQNGSVTSLDPSKLYNSSLHSASFDVGSPSVYLAFSFNGTGLAVYCVLEHPSASTTNPVSTSLSFVLDGMAVGNYTSGPLSPMTTPSFSYNTSVYQNLDLSDGLHTFSINLLPNTTLWFDYAAVYRNNSPTSHPGRGSWIGGLAAALVAGTLLGVGTAVYIRRRKKIARRLDFDIEDGNMGDGGIVEPFQQVTPSHHPYLAEVATKPVPITPTTPTTGPEVTKAEGSFPPIGTSESLPIAMRSLERGDSRLGVGVVELEGNGLGVGPEIVAVEEDAEDARDKSIRLPPPYKKRE